LLTAFQAFDKDGAGQANEEEVRAILGAWNDKLKPEEVEAFMRQAGYRRGVQISLEAFATTPLKGTARRALLPAESPSGARL
jgi:Ca2+-binding EF-hand superfamily protein